MKILFDHNIPRRTRDLLPSHQVSTARSMEWDELSNGQLLYAAQAAGFELLLTADKNLAYQQNLKGRALAIVVLSTNDWSTIEANAQLVIEAVDAATPGSFQAVSLKPTPKR